MAETENVYGVGLSYDLSSGDVRNNMVSISISRTAGKHGISDDTRLALNWTVEFGGGTGTTTSSMGSMSALESRGLLAEVMTRPAFLPNRVLASATGPAPAPTSLCSDLGIILENYTVTPAVPENSVFVRDATGGNGRIGLRIQGQQPTNVSVAASGLAPISLNRLGDGTWFRGNLSLTAQWIGPLEVTIDNTVCLATGVRAQNP